MKNLSKRQITAAKKLADNLSEVKDKPSRFADALLEFAIAFGKEDACGEIYDLFDMALQGGTLPLVFVDIVRAFREERAGLRKTLIKGESADTEYSESFQNWLRGAEVQTKKDQNIVLNILIDSLI